LVFIATYSRLRHGLKLDFKNRQTRFVLFGNKFCQPQPRHPALQERLFSRAVCKRIAWSLWLLLLSPMNEQDDGGKGWFRECECQNQDSCRFALWPSPCREESTLKPRRQMITAAAVGELRTATSFMSTAYSQRFEGCVKLRSECLSQLSLMVIPVTPIAFSAFFLPFVCRRGPHIMQVRVCCPETAHTPGESNAWALTDTTISQREKIRRVHSTRIPTLKSWGSQRCFGDT